jgi:hypothetical protein
MLSNITDDMLVCKMESPGGSIASEARIREACPGGARQMPGARPDWMRSNAATSASMSSPVL